MTIGDIGVKNFDLTSATNMSFFASSSTFTVAAYDEILISYAAQIPIPNNFTITFGNSKYTPGGAAETARSALAADGITIQDGGPDI